MRMKKILALILSLMFVLTLFGCGAGNSTVKQENSASETVSEKAAEPEASVSENTEEVKNDAESETTDTSASSEPASEGESGKTLVVVFSATGNTLAVAEKIAAYTDADLYEIKPTEEYSSADLDWNDKTSRSTIEQNDASSRPEIGSEPVNLEGYTRIFIGYPIWWAIEPRIMDTFVETYDFTGITMIPFCTSGSSGIGNSGKNLEKLAGTGTWEKGMRFKSNATEDEVKKWLDNLE